MHTYVRACMLTVMHTYVNTSEDFAEPGLKSRKSHSEPSGIVQSCSVLSVCNQRIKVAMTRELDEE